MSPARFEPHLELARQRFAALLERAEIAPRVTLRYDPSPSAQTPAPGRIPGEAGGAARAELNRLLKRLPRDCAAVLLDTQLFGKGLQQIEAERGWPRRSAKLVVRIALDALAAVYGLSAGVEGPAHSATRSDLMAERPPLRL